jgi:NAD kinase
LQQHADHPQSNGAAWRGPRLRSVIERGLARRGASISTSSRPRRPATPSHSPATPPMPASDVVVAAGGDGTVHEVANGLMSAGPHTPRSA